MENQIRPYSGTLMAELGAWNRQEKAIGEVFGNDSLKDRDFLKIKLREYERLSSGFRTGTLSRDERSMMTMLKYQRRKIARVVYPGLIRRMLHKAALLLKPALNNKREMEMARQAGLRSYGSIQLPVKDADIIKPEQKQNTVQRQTHRQFPQQQQRRQGPKPHRKKGRSI